MTTTAIGAIQQALEKVKAITGLAGEVPDDADVINDVGLDSTVRFA